jgi:hypothetical protein
VKLTLWGKECEVKTQVSVRAGQAKSYRVWIEFDSGELVAIESTREKAVAELTNIVELLNAQQERRDGK